MSTRSSGEKRAEVIARMRSAFRGGLSATKFIAEMRTVGLSYRRTRMLADWRSINELETKKELLRYVRKDYFPSERIVAQVEWQMSKEYMYTAKVQSRLRPDLPIIESFVNLKSDIPITPAMIAQGIVEKWKDWEKYKGELIGEIIPWSAVHKVME